MAEEQVLEQATEQPAEQTETQTPEVPDGLTLSVGDGGDDDSWRESLEEQILQEIRGETEEEEQPGQTEPAESEDGSAETPEQPAETPASEAEVDERLLNAAAYYGLTPDQIQFYQNNGTLAQAVAYLEQQAQEQQKQQLAGEQETGGSPQGQAASVEDLIELSDDEYDPAVVAQFKKLADHFEQRIAQIEQQSKQWVDAIETQRAQEAHEERVRAFDQFISGLDGSYKTVLGDKPTPDLDPSSQEFQTREKVFQTAGMLAQLKAQRGEPVNDLNELFELAVDIVLKPKAKELARTEIQTKLQRRAQSAVAPPSAREERRPATPEDRAVQAVEKRMQELGVEP